MLVSIIIPTYNRETTIGAAVESVLAQTHRNLEVIVVDDGSVDSTVDVLSAYENRISIIRQPNAGPSAARNRGVDASNGEIIAFLDSDDQWTPTKIERQVALMERGGPGMCCCVCNATVMGIHGEFVGNTFDFAGLRFDFDEGEWTNPQEVLATRFLLFNQVVAVRREAFDRVGGFNEKLRLLEDYELSIRLSSAGTWGVIREPLVMKYNDTNGIGVECMTDREGHARIRAEVISGILGSQNEMSDSARANLERTLRDLGIESRAMAMMRGGGTPARLTGLMLELLLRARKAARRRSPSWPRFRGNSLCF
jgi:glycosyltransferase involved in cell wall biosynthesis